MCFLYVAWILLCANQGDAHELRPANMKLPTSPKSNKYQSKGKSKDVEIAKTNCSFMFVYVKVPHRLRGASGFVENEYDIIGVEASNIWQDIQIVRFA